MKQLPFFLFIISLFTTVSALAQPVQKTLQHDGNSRKYLVYVPNILAQQPVPLVLNFHGLGSSAIEQYYYSAMRPIADTAGFIMVLPEGIQNVWNIGHPDLAFLPTDDIGFLDELLDTLLSNYPIDPTRVYATGMSMGGFFSHTLGCRLRERFAAVASVTGSITDTTLAHCQASAPIPMLQVSSTTDDVVPWEGARGFVSIDSLINFYVARNGCTSPPDSTQLPDISTTDSSTVVKYEWNQCSEENEIVFYKITGSGHAWPGSPIPLRNPNQDFNAGAAIWNFFSRHQAEPSVGISSQPRKVQVDVFPNPVQSVVTISGLKRGSQLQLVDVRGQVVWQARATGAEMNAQLGHLQPGLYLMKVENREGLAVQKVMVTGQP